MPWTPELYSALAAAHGRMKAASLDLDNIVQRVLAPAELPTGSDAIPLDALRNGELGLTTSARDPLNLVGDGSVAQASRKVYVLGAGSLKELAGVDSRLVAVTKLAISISTQDFCVYDGIRTVKEQAAHVKAGTSQTMESKHLDGLAVDLVPWVNGGPKWDWDLIYPIALAVDEAATKLGVANLIRWGGAWDRKLSDFGGNAKAYFNECQAYQQRHPGKDFIDGPHYEISKA